MQDTNSIEVLMSTKTQRDNLIVVDLKKVQWARFYYRNQSGVTINDNPSGLTYWRGSLVDLNDIALVVDAYPNETIGERLKRRGEHLDTWYPELYLKLTANAALIYTGKKAISIWAKWREIIYGRD